LFDLLREPVCKLEDHSTGFAEISGLLNVKYVVLMNDMSPSRDYNPSGELAAARCISNLRWAANFDEIEILENGRVRPKVYGSLDVLVYEDVDSLFELAAKVERQGLHDDSVYLRQDVAESLGYSHSVVESESFLRRSDPADLALRVQRISGDEYFIEIGRDYGRIFIALGESFDSGWKLVPQNTGVQYNIVHVVVNGYANGWLIEQTYKGDTFRLFYVGRDFALFGRAALFIETLLVGLVLVTPDGLPQCLTHLRRSVSKIRLGDRRSA
jgi:hypothetical protein